MKQLVNFLNKLNDDNVIVTYCDKYGSKTSNLNNLKDVVAYDRGSLVKNFSTLSGRILAAGRLYKIETC